MYLEIKFSKLFEGFKRLTPALNSLAGLDIIILYSNNLHIFEQKIKITTRITF